MRITHVEDWQRLADFVASGRVAKGYRTVLAFAEATGLTNRTLGTLERAEGRGFDIATFAAIENALDWEPGSCRRILAGGHPVDLARLDEETWKSYPAASMRPVGRSIDVSWATPEQESAIRAIAEQLRDANPDAR